jgi:hypothetical protein
MIPYVRQPSPKSESKTNISYVRQSSPKSESKSMIPYVRQPSPKGESKSMIPYFCFWVRIDGHKESYFYFTFG